MGYAVVTSEADALRDGLFPGVWISLDGDALDLDEVARLFEQSADPRIAREGDAYFVSAHELESLPDVVKQRTRAAEIVTLINGAATLRWKNHRPLRVGSRVVSVSANGERTESQVVTVDPAISRSRAMPVTVVVGGVPVPPPVPDEPRWVAAAFADDDIAAALRMLADRETSWSELYHVFEIVESTGADMNQWSTKAERDLFTWTANNRGAIGDGARHGHRRWQPPPKPMAHGTARKLIERVVVGWLNERV